jgi:ComF family protein
MSGRSESKFKNSLNSLKVAGASLLNLVFPPFCTLCKDELTRVTAQGLCDDCLEGFHYINNPICTLCGAPFTSKTMENHPCSICTKDKIYFSEARSVVLYKGAARDAIKGFKYRSDTNLGTPLGSLFAAYSSPLLPIAQNTTVMPVPLHKNRLKERGFNQSLSLARAFAKVHKLRLDYLKLIRIKDTMPQVRLKGKERADNIKGAFKLKDNNSFKDSSILLVDDVYTTGATVKECSKVLIKGGAARVSVLTLARVAEL